MRDRSTEGMVNKYISGSNMSNEEVEQQEVEQVKEEPVLAELTNALARLDDAGKRREHAYNYLKKLSPEDAVKLYEHVAEKSLKWEAEHAIFSLLIDQISLFRRMGKNNYKAFWSKLQNSGVIRRSLTIFAEIRERAPEEVLFLQALMNVWLQIAMNVNDQMIYAGHAQLHMELQDILSVIWRNKDFETFKVILDRDEFPEHARGNLIKILEELDFLSVGEGLYELELAESTIEELAAGAIIKSSKKPVEDPGDVTGRISDAMIQKQAEMLLRKIIFAIRGLSMYPPGHPGLKKQFDSALESITELMEGRQMVVLTQMAGSVLINEVRVKSEDRFVSQFVETLEERGISSITFTPGISSDELELLIKMFNYSLTALKDQGGARSYLLNNGVDHVILDQYRYGVISADEEIVPAGSIGYGGWGGGGSGSGGGSGGDGDGEGGSSGGDGSGGKYHGPAGYSGPVKIVPMEDVEDEDTGEYPVVRPADDGSGTYLVSGGGGSGGGPGGGPGGGYGGGPGGGYGGGYGGPGGVGAPGRGPGRNAEVVLLSEIVTRVSGGGALTDITNEEVGTLFKKILAGDVDRNDEFRKSLAELVVSLDPEFMQRTIIESQEVRERLSWTVSRRIINKTMSKLDSDSLEERLAAMEVLQNVGELAVVRHKDSSLRQILGRLCEHLEKFEPDPDTCLQLAENIGNLLARVVINGNLKVAIEFLDKMREASNKMSMHPSRRNFKFRLDAVERMFIKTSTAEAVRYLIRQIGKEKRSLAFRSMKLLEMLKTEEVVVQLMGVFERGSKREKQRAFMTLVKMPDVSGGLMTFQLSSLNDRELFPRKHDNPREMIDEAYFRASNCLGVLAEVWHKDAESIIRSAAHDPDYRLRKETITVLLNSNRPLVSDISKLLLKDPDEEVRSLAVLAMRNPSGKHVISDLAQLFVNELTLRRQIIETIAGIGDRKAMDFLVQSVVLTDKNYRSIYFDDPSLQIYAIQSMAEKGTDRELKAIKAFKERSAGLWKRFRFFPFRYAIKVHRVLAAINETVEEFEKNLIEAAADIPISLEDDVEEEENDQ